jgi:ADP-heptose:LPS heptosyltransferase
MRPDHLGDVLFSFPALKSLRRHLPKARIDMLIGPWARQLLQEGSEEACGVELLEFEAPWLMRPKESRLGLKAVMALARRLRNRAEEIGGPYDLAIDLRGDFQLILAARLAGVRYLVGRGHTGLGFALNAEVAEVRGRHQVENNNVLLEAAGLVPQTTTNPSLKLAKQEIEQARALLRSHGVDRSKILIGVHPGAGVATKRWEMNKFSELIRRMISDLPVRVVLLGGPADRPVADEILTAIKEIRLDRRFIDLCGRLTDLRSFMAVAQQCALYIGNDTGPSHIAAALDVPLICVFSGTNDPAEWGPRGSSVVVIRNRIECEGCGLEMCDHHSCMRQLDVDAVFQAVRRCV